ncbi:MAG: radical SAM family heme chaperone HemW [Bacteroidota bacterium]|nr:radical SAM family heme chaperone HemW [Bacteroidota bacterium]
MLSAIYIHIPFCNKRCNYCDFYLITNLNVLDKFISSLKKEISIVSESYKEYKFDTIFFGGGTPSILTHQQIEDIINHVHKYFNVSSDSEISLESNPEDFLEKKISSYKSAGINRVSFGVQSFIDSELKFLTRQHNASQAESIIKEASKHFDNINLDIIYSLPSQTIAGVDYSLSKAIELNVKHISAYTLTYEERTVLYKSLQKNLIIKNPDSVEAELYNFVSEKLISNGYNQYEVSNFAAENFQCRHNLHYWNYENYIGLGPSAHSFFNYHRWNNYRDLLKYNSMLEQNILPVEEKYELSEKQKKLEFIMLSLRSNGIDFEKYLKTFNEDFEKTFTGPINELIQNNFASMDDKRFGLNEKGYALADEIIAKYF